MSDERKKRGCLTLLVCGLVVCLALYVPSSGPVMAAGFWLRDATGWNGFYAVMWPYAPLLIWGQGTPMMKYIEWWVNLLGTSGPG